MAEQTVLTTRQLTDNGDWSGYWNVGVYDGDTLVAEHRVRASNKPEAEIAARAIITEQSKSGTVAATAPVVESDEENPTEENEEADEESEEESEEENEETEQVKTDQIGVPVPRKRR